MSEDSELGDFFAEISEIEAQPFVEVEVEVEASREVSSDVSGATKRAREEDNSIGRDGVAIGPSAAPAKYAAIDGSSSSSSSIGSSSSVTIASAAVIYEAKPVRNTHSSIYSSSSSTNHNSSNINSNSNSSSNSNMSPIPPPPPVVDTPVYQYATYQPASAPKAPLVSAHTSTASFAVTAPAYATEQSSDVVRKCGQDVWVDNSLKDWPTNDYRLFVGDIGKEVTDAMLIQMFAVYKSFNKAKVVRHRAENKGRGFGFVSLQDPMECAKAIREMDGKYLGGRPISVRRSTWKDQGIEEVKSKEKKIKQMHRSLGIQ